MTKLEDIVKEFNAAGSELYGAADKIANCAELLESYAAAERQFREKLEALRDRINSEADTQETTGFANSARMARTFAEWLTALLDVR